MLIKSGEYDSLWQLVGDLKPKQDTKIPLPSIQHSVLKERETTPVSVEPKQNTTPPPEPNPLPTVQSTEKLDMKSIVNDLPNYLADDSLMVTIEQLQKHHTFPSSLQQAEKDYRKLRRLLNKKERVNAARQK